MKDSKSFALIDDLDPLPILRKKDACLIGCVRCLILIVHKFLLGSWPLGPPFCLRPLRQRRGAENGVTSVGMAFATPIAQKTKAMTNSSRRGFGMAFVGMRIRE